MNARIIILGLCTLLTIGTVTTSCSKDDNGNVSGLPNKESIESAVGTFSGTLSVVGKLPNTDQDEFYNAEIIVTSVGGNKLQVKMKEGEIYSTVNGKVFPVNNDGYMFIMTNPNAVEGTFLYDTKNSTLTVLGVKQQENEVLFKFEGTKK